MGQVYEACPFLLRDIIELVKGTIPQNFKKEKASGISEKYSPVLR